MYNPQDYNLTLDDIPIWMRPQYRGLDWALLLVLLVSGVVLLPLATRSGLPPAPEAEMELYRILEMREGLFTGAFYPRWAADLNYGYGSPLFNHLAPLPHYVGGVYSALVGDDPQIALKIELIIATIVMMSGFFSFLRRRWGDLAGVFGSMVLLFSPYMLLTLPYLRTDLGLLWALAFFCGALWATDRALAFGRGREVMILAVMLALLLVADTGYSPLLFGLAVLWGLLQRFTQPKSHGLAWGLAVVFGMLLTTFYYLPAIVEINEIRWEAVHGYPTAYRADTLFQSPQPLDRGAFNYPAHLYLGVGAWLLAGVGLVVWLVSLVYPKWRHKNTMMNLSAVGFFVLAGLAALVMILWARKPIALWQHQIDPITALDWGGLLLIALAVVAAQAVWVLEQIFTTTGRLAIALSILVGILAISAATSLYVPDFIELATPTTITQHLNDEARGDVMGTFRDGYLLPSSVPNIPVPPANLPRDIQSLPPNTRVTQRSLTHIQYEIFSAEPQPFTLLDFAYPGWEVRLNGELVDPTTTSGLMTVDLARGLNRIELQFATTAPRRGGWWVTGITLAILVIGTLYVEVRHRFDKPTRNYSINWLQQKVQQQRLSAVVVGLLLVVTIGIRVSPTLVTRQTASSAVPSNINTLDLLVTGIRQSGVSLLGYELDQIEFSSGDVVAYLTLYWQPNGQRVDSYQVQLTLLQDTVRVKSVLYKHMAAWPTRRWSPDKYMVGVFEITMPTEPATYQLMIELGLPSCDENELAPCPDMQFADIYDLRGPTGRQIVLPQPMIVYN